VNTQEEQLSDSLLAACKAAGIEEPKYIAQDLDGEVWSFKLKPSKKQSTWDGGHAFKLNHPPYAEDWRDSLLEWVEQGEPLADVLARHGDLVGDDTSKKMDDACKLAYQKNPEKSDGLCWSRYRQGWLDALEWKAMAEEGGASE